jgi:hypothetical protein
LDALLPLRRHRQGAGVRLPEAPEEAGVLRLCTSRWANRELSRLPVVPVGISRGTPRFPVPYRYRLARVLAPSRKTFALRDDAAFEKSYLVDLEGIGVDRIGAVLGKIGDEEGGEALALLCFEDVHAGQVCHRRMFAAWWEQRTGQEVPELQFSVSSRNRPGAQDAEGRLF